MKPQWDPSKPPEEAPFFFTWTAQDGGRPVEITGGEGAWFFTADGTRWLDFSSLVYHANLGHGEARVIEAIKRQAEDLCLTLPHAVYPAKTRLAEALLEIAPKGFSKVFFTLGGSEAVENAIKMARLFTGRYKSISRYRSYHGATLGALSLTGDYRRPPLEPTLVGAIHALDCYCDRCPFGQKVDTCKRECATQIEHLLNLEGAGSVAAVILESIPGANGVLVPPAGYWQRIREACDRHGTLLIADEVLTGFGRTGRWLAIEHEGVVPDMITIGKGLTGGYATLGAVLVHDRIARHFNESKLYAGLTGYAHPLACAAALACIDVYREDDLIAKAERLGKHLMRNLRAMAERLAGTIKFIRGRGLLAALELDLSEEAFEHLADACRRRHVHAHYRPLTQTIIIAPPLCITAEELDLGLARIEEAFREIADGS